jgi:hypothetical protein
VSANVEQSSLSKRLSLVTITALASCWSFTKLVLADIQHVSPVAEKEKDCFSKENSGMLQGARGWLGSSSTSTSQLSIEGNLDVALTIAADSIVPQCSTKKPSTDSKEYVISSGHTGGQIAVTTPINFFSAPDHKLFLSTIAIAKFKG